MDDPTTEVCSRCEEEFDIDEAYRVLTVTDHPHPEDVELGNIRDNRDYLLCGYCATELPVWLDPDADSVDDLHSKSAKELFGMTEGDESVE